MKIHNLYAKPNSYNSNDNGDAILRKLSSIKYIVIHYTGNNSDTAKNNATYFANGNTRSAGAHFFVDGEGIVYRSIKMTWTAWAVGGGKQSANGGTFYGVCTNSNSVSIELCDIASHDATDKQIKAVKKLIKYIKKKCPNVIDVIRHFDVNGKCCPSRYVDNDKWLELKRKVGD